MLLVTSLPFVLHFFALAVVCWLASLITEFVRHTKGTRLETKKKNDEKAAFIHDDRLRNAHTTQRVIQKIKKYAYSYFHVQFFCDARSALHATYAGNQHQHLQRQRQTAKRNLAFILIEVQKQTKGMKPYREKMSHLMIVTTNCGEEKYASHYGSIFA